MSTKDIHNRIVNHVRHHGSHGGVTTAVAYLKHLAADIGKEEAAVWFGYPSYAKAASETRSKLTFYHPGFQFKSADEPAEPLPPGVIASVDSIVSTPQKDWDGDIVRSEGLTFDPNGPLLRGHEQKSPYGKIVSVTDQDENRAVCKFHLADMPLARDSLALMRIGALRKSIGFRALEASPLSYKMVEAKKVPATFDIKRAFVMETSGVAIPANPGAEILRVYEKQYDEVRTLASKGLLQDPLMKIWGKAVLDSRAVVSPGADFSGNESTLDTVVEKHIDSIQADKDIDCEKAAGEKIMTKGVHVGMDNDLPGSYEQRISAIDEGVKKYLCREDPDNCSESHYAYVIGTYDTDAVVCMRAWRESGPDRKCYRVDYTVGDDGKAKFSGFKSVKVEPAVIDVVEEKAAQVELATKGDSADDFRRLVAKVATGEIECSDAAGLMAGTVKLLSDSARAKSLDALFSAGAE